MRKKISPIFYSLIAILFLVACGEGENAKVNIGAENNEVEESTLNSENGDLLEDEADLDEGNLENEQVEKVEDKNGKLTVHFIDVGQAESTLFEYVNGDEVYRILYDAGDWNRHDVVQYLQSKGVSSLDILVGTHIHADHIGQMDKIIEQFDVGEVWMTGNTGTSETFMRVLDAIEANDVGYHEPRAGEVYDIGPLVVEILHPTTLTSNPNENSISMKLTYGDVSLILTGDAEIRNEASIISSGYDLDANILQLGHHGSNTSTSKEFLLEVNPDIAIYSAGQGNSYGHPHEDVVSLIKEHGIELYGTDVHGTIVLTTDGSSFSIGTENDGTVKSPPINTSAQESVGNNEQSRNENEVSSAKGECVDINSASISQLQEIIHIGPARAEEILQKRPYKLVDELMNINGIGPARLQDIMDQNIACIGG